MDNKIRELRKEKGLSIKKIGEAVGASRQHIELIEKGLSSPHFDLAAKICNVLGAPFQTVFPTTKRAIESYHRRKDLTEGFLHDDEFLKDMLSAGIDINFEQWFFSYSLRGGAKGNLPISTAVKHKLSSSVQRILHTDTYAVFDSPYHRILLNLDHLLFWQFLFESQLPIKPKNKGLEDKDNYLFVYVYDQATPFKLPVNPDTTLLENATDCQAAQLQAMIVAAERMEETNVFMITDNEGDVSFFKIRDVALIKIPLEKVEIGLAEKAL